METITDREKLDTFYKMRDLKPKIESSRLEAGTRASMYSFAQVVGWTSLATGVLVTGAAIYDIYANGFKHYSNFKDGFGMIAGLTVPNLLAYFCLNGIKEEKAEIEKLIGEVDTMEKEYAQLEALVDKKL